jgi:regulator of protease activity HflC (stomatin/prohibitin superfamily)
MSAVVVVVIAVLVLVVIWAMLSVRVVQQYERGVVFRFGEVQDHVRTPGLAVIVPIADRLQKVNLQIITMSVPAQDCITRDNVSVRVDAVVYFQVVDPVKALVNVSDYGYAISQVAQTSMRSVIGRADLDDLLSNREKLNAELTDIIDAPTEQPWGVKVQRVEVKDVALPDAMKRSMSRQAEAERERRARVIAADGEFQASQKLAQAAATMSADPAALQLRLLQTVVEVAAEKNSTLVMPFPVELLRFLDHASSGAVGQQPAAQQAGARQPAARQAGAQQKTRESVDTPPAPQANSAVIASTVGTDSTVVTKMASRASTVARP